jgi:alkylhydroperoxidase family enzyme
MTTKPQSGTAAARELFPHRLLGQMDPELAEMLRPRVERLGYLGEFFQIAALQPAAMKSFYRFTEDLKKALPDNLTEVVALTVASYMENAYERVQHERLSLKLGLGERWLRDVLARDPGKDQIALSAVERSVQALALAVLERRGRNTGRELAAVVSAIGPEQAVAALMLIGRYTTHAQIVNSLELPPPVASPLEESK